MRKQTLIFGNELGSAHETTPLPWGCRYVARLTAPTHNSSDTPRLIFKDEAGRTAINDAALYQRLQKEFAP